MPGPRLPVGEELTHPDSQDATWADEELSCALTVLRRFGTFGAAEENLRYLMSAQIKRGRSGACFTSGRTGSITKTGPAGTKLGSRVLDQGRWLTAHATRVLPTVHEILEDGHLWGYRMERLVSLPLDLLDGQTLVAGIARALCRNFRCQQARVSFDEAAHAERLRPIVAPLTGRHLAIFRELYTMIDWDRLTPGLTHGDPIFDNVLFRPDGTLVLTDPIPATPALPDVAALDVGRLFQSCVGYERVAYRLNGPQNVSIELAALAAGLPDGDLAAAFYFGIVHLLRAMVYVAPETARALLEECVVPLAEEAAWRL